MEIETFFIGVHPDGTKFRIRRIDAMWYYAIQIKDEYDGWVWNTIYRSPSKLAVVSKVIEDKTKREERDVMQWAELL